MGKEQDLLQAAKSGNVAHIEKILGHKARKSGIQGFISRTINPNHQDELGNTPLHYAALNGHRSSAELLLKYDASTNIPDNSGNYPLHLAAWNGHADVAKVLINTGPSRANVNEQNGTEDTALHSAAQFGHSLVVAVLLENHADPYVRNSRQESPLDLAAQYGRMETVKQLLNYHPNLLEDVNVVQTHTPLHLASKNGHMNVVSYFLSCGMDVNLTCTTGTALHEAALFGKADVVNLLLQCGIDVTVVDSNNKTVLDLLASHPSAKAKEIRELIFASSLKEPTSRLKRQLTEFHPSRKPFSGIRAAGHGFPGRPSSAVYQRNLSYDDVPNPIPYRKDMDPSLMRRSGTYDAVPPPRSRQSLEQPSYDIVPPPKEATSPVDWTKYDEVQGTSSNSGYALLGPAENPATGTPPVLTPHDIHEGYTLLGTPAQEATAKPLRPVHPDSTYATVRPEGEDLKQVRNGAPSQTAFDDYSCVGFPTASEEKSESAQDPAAKPLHPVHTVSTYDFVRLGRDSSVPDTDATPPQTAFDDYCQVGFPTAKGDKSEPMPISEMVGSDNPTYLMVGEQSSIWRSQPQRQNSETYDFVQPKPRAVSQPSVYEVPPPSVLRGRGNGQEGDAFSAASLPSRASRGQSFDLYENTSISSPPRESQQRRASDYDTVAFPLRKASVEGGSYDLVPPPTQIPQDQSSSSQNRPISMTPTRAQGDVCPLSTSEGYDFVQIRKPGTETNDSAPEMQPFAPLPGYEPMGPPQDTGYEVLSASEEVQEQLRDYGGTYETLSVACPQRAGSQTEPGSRNIPVSAPLYEVPPIKSPPLYEIAPPPRTVNPVPPLPPRPAPVVQPQPPSSNEIQWIEKEPIPPQVPPKRQNEYSQWYPGMGREPVSPGLPVSPGSSVKSPKQTAYEQVRIEGPKKSADALDWDRVKELSMQRYGGEYCTLSPTAVGPRETSNRDSTVSASSERSSVTEPVMTPPFSPPSPRTAEATLFEAFGSFQSSDMSTIPEAPEDVKEQTPASEKREAPIPKPRRRHSQNVTKPKILPRSDSLYDEEFDVAPKEIKRTRSLEEVNQDPFSFPPVVKPADVSPNKDGQRKSDFSELHKRFSPFSSREDIFTDTDDPKNEREEPDGAEAESDVKPSPLIYENVLFRRSDTTENDVASKASENGSPLKQDESTNRPEPYRLSTLPADSLMNEMEEWEKIEAFLSSISQIEVPQTLEEQIAHAGKADSIPGWLNALDLAQYESSMMANGFDNINFLNGVLEDEDLLDIGIVDFSHRRTIMEALKSLPACPRLSDPTTTKPQGLKDWLELICLPEYFEVFQHNGYTSMDRIHMLWAVELTSVLEVNSLGHQKRILASIKEDVKDPGMKEQEEAPNLDESSAQLQEQLAELKKYCPDEKPPTVPTPTPRTADDLMATAEQMIVSAKEVASKTPKEHGGSKWKHDSSVLIKGCVNYKTLYLGSHAVKTITGIESTIDACRKMRLSTAKLQKIPSVILSVSVKGIKFIDARSKIMVSFHDMRNISYITQDQEERCVFAYIAKDAKTDKHYCHVFRVDSNALSDEVTMTIGQAFELAFSQFVQAKNRRSKH